MTQNNMSPLAFYMDLNKQDHRRDYSHGKIFPLVSPINIVPPFQFIASSTIIDYVKIINLSTGSIQDITGDLISLGLTSNVLSGYNVIKYPGVLPIASLLDEGTYYLEIAIDGIKWYSEVFALISNLDNYLKLEYHDSENFYFENGVIDFSGGFRFIVYLDTQLGRPDYIFKEEVEERDGRRFYESQVSEKIFRCTFLATEYLLDALRLVRMVDYVTIINRGDEYEVDDILLTVKWLDVNHLASVDAEIRNGTILKKIGKGFPATTQGGDFNDDFNNDFKID